MPRFIARFNALERDLKLLWAGVFCMMFGFGVYSAVFYNFATESLRIRPDQLGLVEAVREAPGLLCVFVAAITIRVAEPVVGSVSLLLAAVSMAAYGWVRNVPSLMVLSLAWSIGSHMWMPLQSSMALNLAADGKRGKRLGQTWCVTGLGMVGGMLAVRLVNNALSYPAWFFVGGAWTLAAAAILFFMRRDIGHAQRPRFALNRRYSLYYCLALLEGGRRQVFCTFAVYALTKVYHTPLKTIATLMVINGVVNIFGGPVVGRMIDRTGERRILMFSYFVLIFVFAGYATIKIPQVLYVLYCLDNLLFLSTTCLTTYVQRIGKPEDLTTTLSTGVTAGHIAAVLVPLVGGYLWASLGYPATFFGGAGLVIMSLFLAARVPPLKLKQAREVE